jgi:hypothetical protein
MKWHIVADTELIVLAVVWYAHVDVMVVVVFLGYVGVPVNVVIGSNSPFFFYQ